MWVYTTQGIAQNIWGTTDATSNAFNKAGNWTGVIFAAYSVLSFILFSDYSISRINTEEEMFMLFL